ncbi:phosphatase PAP2 family protein [Arthrobacter roseus]|uniref:phosphatase PAP2 family protein n=1 Tax=Arthrobacter roseus TaxID=136274 RepID=UPI00196482BF|nr:phosphatase PAP2 family protein [Arthrobacter roseus]MBM7846831.1 undecaprenyl-diphosphatase [Arthrobacter roseus]
MSSPWERGPEPDGWTPTALRPLIRFVQVLARWMGPHLALVLILVIGGGFAIAFTAVSGEIYESVVEKDGLSALDEPALKAAVALRSPGLNTAVTVFTNVGGPIGMPILAGAAAVVLSLKRKSVAPLLLMIVAAAGSLLMTLGGKQAIGRLRPPMEFAIPPFEYSPSFPSGHTLNATVLAGVFAYLLILRQRHKRTRVLTVIVAVLFVVAMGLSRVYLGHHWLTDVIVAWTLGVAWLAVVVSVHRLVITFLGRRRTRGDP